LENLTSPGGAGIHKGFFLFTLERLDLISKKKDTRNVGIFHSLLLHKTACLYKDLIASHSLSNNYLSLPDATGLVPDLQECQMALVLLTLVTPSVVVQPTPLWQQGFLGTRSKEWVAGNQMQWIDTFPNEPHRPNSFPPTGDFMWPRRVRRASLHSLQAATDRTDPRSF